MVANQNVTYNQIKTVMKLFVYYTVKHIFPPKAGFYESSIIRPKFPGFVDKTLA